jgi:cytochrome c heme-lyase
MFYNALARKGKLGDTDEQEVESVVALHNNMNEKTWRKVLEWEQVLYPGESPKLLKFMGRPTDLSPKAMVKHYLLGHPLPYDRHDWTVLRKDGSTVRYIIDYYYDDTRAIDDESSGMPKMDDTSATPSLLVDVRPALDGPKEAWSRAVTMPYARHVVKSTNYEFLPLRPTGEMLSQVQESVQTWDNIQAAAAASKKAVLDDISKSMPEISEKDAVVLSRDFAQALRDCRETSLRVKNAKSEMDMAKARMDLTICMGKIICPLPHETFIKALSDESASADDNIETAINNVTECVYMKTGEHSAAREKFPKLFV